MRSRYLPALVVALGLTPVGRASVLLDTGVDTFAATGIQFGRITRTGEASVWGSTKPFPGVTGAPLERGYEIFTVDSGVFPFLQISLDDPTAGLYMAAYRDSFHPSNLPPNYGLDINYLGDPGSSQPFGNPSFFQIQVAPRTQVMIPINEVTPGGGAGRPFELIVEGFLDSSFGDVPEPGSWALFAGGAVGLLALRARASRRRSRKEPRV